MFCLRTDMAPDVRGRHRGACAVRRLDVAAVRYRQALVNRPGHTRAGRGSRFTQASARVTGRMLQRGSRIRSHACASGKVLIS